VFASNDALEKLKLMGQAAKQLNYDGVFSYQAGKSLQSIRIIHRKDEEGEIERLVSLNGAAREVIRTNDMVTCIYPEGKRVNANRRPLGRGFPGDLIRRLDAAADFYQIKTGSTGRIAGRAVDELIIKPIDEYRYGYRLWIDQESHLLLKSELINADDSVLETFAFSTITLPSEIPDHLLTPEISNRDAMTWDRTEPETAAKMAESKSLSKWQFNWMPDGFALVGLQSRLKAKNGASVEHRVYSDGLSAVSVFFEKIRARHSHLHGGSRMGAVNAFGTIINTHFVTVVGEVPEHTVTKIGSKISYTE
jgi:sigma-E factor negative regulatory protein RseB